MPKEVLIFLGAIVGAAAAYITARITGRNQLEIAKINCEKDLQLQSEKLLSERVTNEIALEREKLESLHLILSKISLENSKTMSFFQSDSDTSAEEFRVRYLENCHRIHEGLAIADLYYPEMSELVREVYSQMNMFWGYQEGVIKIDSKINREGWLANLNKVTDACHKISKEVTVLQNRIASRGEQLNKALHQTSW